MNFGFSSWNCEEIVHRIRDLLVIGDFHAIHHGNIHLHDHAFSAGKSLLCRNNHSSILILRNGHIAPPVHRNHFTALVDDPHTAVQETAVLLQPEIDLIRHLADSLILIEAENRKTVLCLRFRCVHRLGGKGMMADDTDVPLHATAEPGIADSQVTETQNVIGVKEIFSCGLVPEFPETAAVLRQENCLQVVIFQDC